MFQKTYARLTWLNTAVVAIIFAVLGFILYAVLNTSVENKLEQMMQTQHERVVSELVSGNDYIKRRDVVKDPRALAVLWLNDGTFVTYPEMMYITSLEELRPNSQDDIGYRNWMNNGNHFRVLTEPFFAARSNIAAVQIVWLANSEYEQMLLLKRILILGFFVAVVLAFGIGRVLARYALVPIRKSWEQQERFVGDASHELRTPLAVIQGQTEGLLQEPDDTVMNQIERVGKILQETRRMNTLITDLLLLAKTDSNQLQLQKKREDISAIVADVTDYFEDVAMMKDISFRVFMKENIHHELDSARFRQLLVILLDNAIKYTNEGGSIDVKVEKERDKLELIVRDTGIGIAKENIPHVFERFYRVNKARTREESGTGGHGLGLSIAKWIVDSHGGTIAVESTEGVGTTFKITL